MKKIIIAIIMALIIPFNFSRAFSLGEPFPDNCIVWRVGMPPKVIDGKTQTQYNYCSKTSTEYYKRVYELEVEVIILESKISKLEEENNNLRNYVSAKQDETRQLLIQILNILLKKS